MWSKVFVTEINGEKIAIILLDTQGTFDDEHTMTEHSNIFGMVTLLSSFQIYNVLRDIEEDDLQALALFTQHAEHVHNSSDIKLGQHLQILVRDWSFPHEFPYGSEGGKQHLEAKMSTANRKQEFVRIREALKSSYEHISSYLMPSPGDKIKEDPDSDGKIVHMKETFVQYLREYVPFVVDNLPVKKFHGKSITVGELAHYIRNIEKILTEADQTQTLNVFEVIQVLILFLNNKINSGDVILILFFFSDSYSIYV